MEQINTQQAIYELTLALLYLNRFTEDNYGMKIERSWKGYDFDVLNHLEELGYIFDGKRPSKTKSVYISQEGLDKAQEILKKYNIKDWNKK